MSDAARLSTNNEFTGDQIITGGDFTVRTSAEVNVISANVASKVVQVTGPSSTSTTSGALQVSGGVGVSEAINAASVSATNAVTSGTLSVSGSASVGGLESSSHTITGGDLTVRTSAEVDVISTNVADGEVYITGPDSTSRTSGALQVSGGVGVNGNITSSTLSATGNVSIGGVASSSSPSTGALVVSGGVGIGGALNVGSRIVTQNSIHIGEGADIVTVGGSDEIVSMQFTSRADPEDTAEMGKIIIPKQLTLNELPIMGAGAPPEVGS